MANMDFIAPTDKYENWNVYKLSLIIVDITDLFVKTYLPKFGDRTVDQMVQAARSCKQNIVEGSVDAATSREMELKLTNVAKGSLAELMQDYEDYMRHHDLTIWSVKDPRVSQIRRFSRMHDKPEIYLTKLRERDAEAFCNITLTLCHQLDYMLYCVMERAKAIFLQKGGIREEMYRARIAARNGNQNQSHQSNQRNQSHLKDGSNQNNLSRRPANSSDSSNSSDKNQADR
jgi:four helix bundle suffix protein